MTTTYLEFEKPIAELDAKISELEALASTKEGPSITDELKKLKAKSNKQLKDMYSDLSAWRKTLVARHPDRPHFSDFVENVFEDFEELAGDRVYGNDEAVVGGLARFKGRPVVIMGHEKGRTIEKRLKHNFGMAHPEGYRKAVRLMDLAEKFNMPVLSFPDTQGAYPGKGGEERGQAEAIARGTQRGLSLGVPFVTLIIGEGMSGGAIGIAAANKVLMMEHAIYSVISPEGCASILYRDAAKAKEAADAMKITAPDLLKTR
ncbi:acetyl-CoA carboxylase carboxyltransferase subunit alpha, partial [Cobetia sp. Dlab-2-U]|nr:acetyl-CoA carboxylase carboxyltransferase subunit alpha [Cobetia sp. Dlab-2-U]